MLRSSQQIMYQVILKKSSTPPSCSPRHRQLYHERRRGVYDVLCSCRVAPPMLVWEVCVDGPVHTVSWFVLSWACGSPEGCGLQVC